jgi:hypothetical protein
MLQGNNERFVSGKYMGHTFESVYKNDKNYTEKVILNPTRNFVRFKQFVEKQNEEKNETETTEGNKETTTEAIPLRSYGFFKKQEENERKLARMNEPGFKFFSRFQPSEKMYMYCVEHCGKTMEAVICDGWYFCRGCGSRCVSNGRTDHGDT